MLLTWILTSLTGDPTVFGNFPRPKEVTSAMIEVVRAGDFDGYAPSIGYPFVRDILAKKINKRNGNRFPVTIDDIIVGSGCSHAIDMAISGLCNPEDNILLPKPGFSLYQTICQGYGIQFKKYPLVVRA